MKAFLTLVMLSLATTAFAHDSELTYDRISLSASAQREVQNDTIIATLYTQEEGSDAARLADIVNRRISDAVDRLKQHSGLKLQTNAYTTSPIYNKNKIHGWRVRQSLRIESRDMAKVSVLLGQLQSQLSLQDMQFAISPELRTRTNDELISEALAAFEKRAKLVTEQLGSRGYRIVDINISTSGGHRPYSGYARAAMMDSAVEVAAPAVEAGEATVQVTVNGSIELE